jgi:hypothetical protein
VWNGIACLDLELGVFWPAELDRGRTTEPVCRDEPPPPVADQHEDEVASRRVESLDQPGPTLVPATVQIVTDQRRL